MKFLFLIFLFLTQVVFATLTPEGGGSGNAVSLQGTPISAVSPSLNNCLAFDGTSWAPAVCSGGSSYTFADSVVNTTGTVTLVGDSATPGASKYYGTNSGSTLGYNSFPTWTVGQGGTGLTAGTSGGIPYYSSTSAMTSSALLTAHGVMVGGGAATTPATIAVGTTGQVLTGASGANPSFQANAALRTNVNSVSAAGTNQSTATVLSGGFSYQVVTSVSSGTGVKLPTAAAGNTVTITNQGANPLLVYPGTSGTINSGAANAAVTLPVNFTYQFNAVTTTNWNADLVFTGDSGSGGVAGFVPAPPTGSNPSGGPLQLLGANGSWNIGLTSSSTSLPYGFAPGYLQFGAPNWSINNIFSPLGAPGACMAAQGRNVFACDNDFSHDFAVYQQFSYYPFGYANASEGDVQGIALSGQYAYINGYNPGSMNGYMRIFDISTPATPTYTGVYSLGGGQGNFKGIAAQGNYVYIADSTYGLRVIDVTNPASPVQVGSYNSAYSLSTAIINGKYLYMGSGTTPVVFTFDISNPASPAVYGSGTGTGTGGTTFAVSGNLIFQGNTQVFNVFLNTASSISVISSYNLSTGSTITVAAGKYVYFNDGVNLYVADVTDPTAIHLQRSGITLPDVPTAAVAFDNYLYIMGGSSGASTAYFNRYSVDSVWIPQLDAGVATLDSLYVRSAANLAELQLTGGLTVGRNEMVNGNLTVQGALSTGSFSTSSLSVTTLTAPTIDANNIYFPVDSTPTAWSLNVANQTNTNVNGNELDINLSAGNGTGNGGSMVWYGGAGGSTSGNGSNFYFVPGLGGGTGATGVFGIINPVSGQIGALDMSLVTSGQDFQFPNWSGVLQVNTTSNVSGGSQAAVCGNTYILTSGAAFTMPSPVLGCQVTFKDQDGHSSTISPFASEHFDQGVSSIVLYSPDAWVTEISDGTNWNTISAGGLPNFTVTDGSNVNAVCGATYLCTPTSSTITVNAPPPSNGCQFTVTDVGGHASYNQSSLDIKAYSGENFNGVSNNLYITSNFGSQTLLANGTNWTTTAYSGQSGVLTATTGLLTSVAISSNTILTGGFTPNGFLPVNFEAVAYNLNTCSTPPMLLLLDCGSDITCSTSPPTQASVQVVTQGSITQGTINGTVIGGDYWAIVLSAGTCASLNISVTTQL